MYIEYHMTRCHLTQRWAISVRTHPRGNWRSLFEDMPCGDALRVQHFLNEGNPIPRQYDKYRVSK